MTRKDYIALAAAIREEADYNVLRLDLTPEPNCADAYNGCTYGRDRATRSIAARIAAVLAADNPRFDRERFLAACGVVEMV